MNKTVLVSTLALVLAGCACIDSRAPKPDSQHSTDSQNPAVSVVEGKHIVVHQEPLYFDRGQKDVKVTWWLPANSRYRFPKDGIVVRNEDGEFEKCHAEENGMRFACMNLHKKPGTYKYTIRVEGSPAVPPLDPTIVNY